MPEEIEIAVAYVRSSNPSASPLLLALISTLAENGTLSEYQLYNLVGIENETT